MVAINVTDGSSLVVFLPERALSAILGKDLSTRAFNCPPDLSFVAAGTTVLDERFTAITYAPVSVVEQHAFLLRNPQLFGIYKKKRSKLGSPPYKSTQEIAPRKARHTKWLPASMTVRPLATYLLRLWCISGSLVRTVRTCVYR